MGYIFVEGSKGIQKYNPFMKKSFQFVALVTLFSAMYSYFSGFPLFFFYYYNLQFSTLILPPLGQVLDRKFMFLICNAILAFLAKNVKFTHSTFNHNAQDGVDQLTDELATGVLVNKVPMDHADDPPDPEFAVEPEREEQVHFREGAQEREENQTTGVVLESADWEYCHDEFDSDDTEDDEDGAALEATEQPEHATDARVSTEELNKKFEEFIRKMKEEIRVEAQQPLITV